MSPGAGPAAVAALAHNARQLGAALSPIAPADRSDTARRAARSLHAFHAYDLTLQRFSRSYYTVLSYPLSKTVELRMTFVGT